MDIDAKHVFTAPNVVCPNCGNKVFVEAAILKKLSPILSPTGKEELYPIPVFVCSKCGTVPEEYTSKPNAKYIFNENESEAGSEQEEQKESTLIMP